MLSLYFNNNTDSQLLVGKCLRLGGSREIYENNESYYGDLSAIMIDNLPFWAELSSTPSSKTSLIPEWEDKVKAIIKESIKQEENEIYTETIFSVPLKEARENFEKDYLTTQLKKFGGNVSKTAKFVGMERSALHRKLKQLGITEDLKK